MSSPPPSSDTDASNAEEKRIQQRKQSLQRFFLILLVAGLVVGTVLAFGLIRLMDRLGLTDRQPQIEQLQNTVPQDSAPHRRSPAFTEAA